MLKVALYLRVSTDDQATDGDSLAEQEAKLRAHCVAQGLDPVVVLIDEGVSASKPLAERPEGQRIAGILKARQVAAIVATKLDRLFRDTVDCLTTVEAWDKRGVGLHLLDFGGQSIDTKSAMGRMFLTMMAGFGEFERRLTGERTAAVMKHKASKGEYCGGDAPYGYVRKGDVIVELPAEQAVIARARQLKANGLGDRRIARTLLDEGLRPRSGGEWFAPQVERMLRARVAAA